MMIKLRPGSHHWKGLDNLIECPVAQITQDMYVPRNEPIYLYNIESLSNKGHGWRRERDGKDRFRVAIRRC